MKLTVNGETREFEADPDMPLLWALRDLLDVKGPKYGCGISACGACTVWIDGVPTRSCTMPVGVVEGAVTTIEGLPAAMPAAASASGEPPVLSAVQTAWEAEQVPQCGYCQSGQIMAAAALLRDNPAPTDQDIDDAMTNLCRCGTYPRIRAAIHRAAGAIAEG
ncbi:(2Fe-2S)-binding protein [Rhodovulum sp. DZ06]|uniref:(2Fe-2S)-binding protein n=1 Tax=Rhodovulum sp. DZ06 TaxID=3425126 RepID=UPI003D330DA6